MKRIRSGALSRDDMVQIVSHGAAKLKSAVDPLLCMLAEDALPDVEVIYESETIYQDRLRLAFVVQLLLTVMGETDSMEPGTCLDCVFNALVQQRDTWAAQENGTH